MEKSAPILFDRARLRKRYARAAVDFSAHDFLWREATARLEESLSYIARDFSRTLAFGGHALSTAKMGMLTHAGLMPLGGSLHIIADEEYLPVAPESFDAILCILNLHWVNDIPGTLAQMQRALKPDGLFMAITLGGETLRELRQVLATTEESLFGGVSPRVAPFMDVRDAGALLQRAGFALPVADSEVLDVSYADLFALMADLRGAGQGNMLQQQVQHFTPRRFFLEAAKRYHAAYGDAEERIHATIELITLTGWKPAAGQQQPARRGSGTVSLRDALN